MIDQGPAYPVDPTISLRTSFRDVVLRDLFREKVRDINTTEDGTPWLTDKQLDELYDEVTGQTGHSLLEINEAVQQLLYRIQVDHNELTGEEDPNVKLIDFHHPARNDFLAINQFRVDTPGCVKECIIPDIVLFVNGLPLVVIECKVPGPVEANPLAEAFKQLLRYRGMRGETHEAGLKEGEPKLFHTNQIVIRTTGEQCEFGTITANTEEYFYPWRDIYPEHYRDYEPPLGQERQQELLIQGMLPPATLLSIIRTCTLFMDVGKTRARIVCRYQQYRAACKIIERLRKGKTPEERSGVIWHTQGSGKSLTMVFVIRMLRMCEDLKDYKVCLINDRQDLEDQLTGTAKLAGEPVSVINSTEQLRRKLSWSLSNLNMVMVHKFHENQSSQLPLYVQEAVDIPRYETFGTVNESERILLMIDEAHRSQAGDLGDNLFEAFPNATRLAFTGTPLIEVDEQRKTIKRFGGYIDKYKLKDAVEDGATVQILYEGKTDDTAIAHKHEFDDKVDAAAREHVESQLRKADNLDKLKRQADRDQRAFDDLVKERTEEEILALKKKWGTNGDLYEADERIREIAADMVHHYIDHILPNGFKAQVVCSSKMAAIKYKRWIDEALQTWLETEDAKPAWTGQGAPPDDERDDYRDDHLRHKVAFMQSAVIISSDGTNEAAAITNTRKHARSVNAVDNFQRAFDYDDPEKVNTGIAFLIVCDMLLTGFDAPIEQVMYIDKKVKEHNLLQTIARVNRVHNGKQRGYIVDYCGLSNHLKDALSIYNEEDRKDIEDSLQNISVELPVLEARYERLLNLFRENGVPRIQAFVEQTIEEAEVEYDIMEQAVTIMEEIKLRASFEVYFKKFTQSLDIILPHSADQPYKIPVRRFGFLMAMVRERYKDETLNISGAGEKVRKLIDEHLVSLGINPKIPPVELLSSRFIQELDKNRSAKAKASEMEHAIRKHCKIKFEEDPAFYQKLSEKLEALIKQHQDNWDALVQNLFPLRQEAQEGRKDDIEGVTASAAPFYDLIGTTAFDDDTVPERHAARVKQLVAEIMECLQETIAIINFWGNPPEVKRLEGDLSDLIYGTGIDELIDHCDRLVSEIAHLAKKRHDDIAGT